VVQVWEHGASGPSRAAAVGAGSVADDEEQEAIDDLCQRTIPQNDDGSVCKAFSCSICVEELMRARDRRGDGTWSPPGVRAIQLQVIAILLAPVYRLKSVVFSR